VGFTRRRRTAVALANFRAVSDRLSNAAPDARNNDKPEQKVLINAAAKA
jgi:hypothetical protein